MRIGGGCVKEIGSVLKQVRCERPLIITDPYLAGCGLVDRVKGLMAGTVDGVGVYSATIPDPTSDSIRDLAAFLGSAEGAGYDSLVAVGGGSPMDTAKGALALVERGGAMRDYNSPTLTDAPFATPLVCVPTTAGTGSETTRFTAVTCSETGEKMRVVGDAFVPVAAICDWELTMGAPPGLTADTGVDALCHAMEAHVGARKRGTRTYLRRERFAIVCFEKSIQSSRPEREMSTRPRTSRSERKLTEGGASKKVTGFPAQAYVSSRRNAFADGAAIDALRSIGRHIHGAYANEPEGREGMMYGSFAAGIAFSSSSVTLVHGMSRPLGAHFHIAHGRSNAVIAPHLTAFSVAGDAARYDVVRDALGFAGDLPAALAKLNADLNIPSLYDTLVDLGYDEAQYHEAIPTMASEALASGSPSYNPVLADQGQIETLYAEIYAQGKDAAKARVAA